MTAKLGKERGYLWEKKVCYQYFCKWCEAWSMGKETKSVQPRKEK